jgi:hypothetical protein
VLRVEKLVAEDSQMDDNETLGELDIRIATIRENIRELIEQAAAYSGAADEDRNADRIADQDAHLAELLKKRDALVGNSGEA